MPLNRKLPRDVCVRQGVRLSGPAHGTPGPLGERVRSTTQINIDAMSRPSSTRIRHGLRTGPVPP
ncbi:hypothetical protein SCOCK_240083 [Actinacidiphila cocklensis]|uniref:Uncharacterized protein n=1 Tax=Actinacidiphila cocklensis TaxID=887465 RepID=A0A9W4E6S0_9ACTN|nr:hypothetical protein SCOCK_240083 [Actinacidiphila cocklensis]